MSIFLFSLLLHPNYAHRVGISRPLVRLLPRGNFLACLDPPSVHPNAFLAAPVQNKRGRGNTLGSNFGFGQRCMHALGWVIPLPGFLYCASVRCLQEALCWYNTRSSQGEEMDRDSSLGRRRRSWWMHGVRRCIPSSFLGTVIGQLCPLPPTKKSRRTGPGCMTRERERERESLCMMHRISGITFSIFAIPLCLGEFHIKAKLRSNWARYQLTFIPLFFFFLAGPQQEPDLHRRPQPALGHGHRRGRERGERRRGQQLPV